MEIVRLGKHHVLDLHEPCAARTVTFLQLHRYETYRFGISRDQNMLKRVDAAARLFDFHRHALGRFFYLGKLTDKDEVHGTVYFIYELKYSFATAGDTLMRSSKGKNGSARLCSP